MDNSYYILHWYVIHSRHFSSISHPLLILFHVHFIHSHWMSLRIITFHEFPLMFYTLRQFPSMSYAFSAISNNRSYIFISVRNDIGCLCVFFKFTSILIHCLKLPISVLFIFGKDPDYFICLGLFVHSSYTCIIYQQYITHFS